MLYVITGGSGSGKSEYAERLAAEKHKTEYPEGRLLYVATMYPYGTQGTDERHMDKETELRINRHRSMRRDKGFSTVECYTDIGSIDAEEKDVILLECMSNLLANEMYLDEGGLGCYNDAWDKVVVAPLLDMEARAGCVIVVTNEVFSDGCPYEKEAMRYIRLLGEINQSMARRAVQVTEVVCGIPVVIRTGRDD